MEQTILRGTQKQIAWANDIRERVLESVNFALDFYAQKSDPDVNTVAVLNHIVATINAEEWASKVIEVFAEANQDDVKKRLQKILFIVRFIPAAEKYRCQAFYDYYDELRRKKEAGNR